MHRATNARVFGSILHGFDTAESDLDILVETTEDTTLFDLGAIRYKLRNLLGVPVGRFYAAPLQGEMNVAMLQSKSRPRPWELHRGL